MKLVQPTDFEILAPLNANGRNNALNIAAILEKKRQYINTRLPQLADYGLVERVGPAEHSGLDEITERGRVALDHRDSYSTTDSEFEARIERELER